jgi:hypothetical protein
MSSPDLFQLAMNGKLDALKCALDADDAAVDRPQAGGLHDSRTLLMSAATRGHADVVCELLLRGADASATDKRGATASSLAQKQGHAQVVSLLEASEPASKPARANASVPGATAPKAAAAAELPKALDDESTVEAEPPTVASSNSPDMVVRVHVDGGPAGAMASLLVRTVANAEAVKLCDVLETLGSEHSLRLSDWRDALGKPITDVQADVFAAWLEHGESAEGSFESDLHMWCHAEQRHGSAEAASIYDLLDSPSD